jgi:hypothetical protein
LLPGRAAVQAASLMQRTAKEAVDRPSCIKLPVLRQRLVYAGPAF